jgi:hypothetical protein
MTPIQEGINLLHNKAKEMAELGLHATPSAKLVKLCGDLLKPLLEKEKQIIESAYDSGVGHVIYKNNLPVEGTNVTVSGEDYYKSKF